MGTKSLYGVSNLGSPTLTDILEVNLISFFDWGFSDKGGYFNITIPSSGLYGGDRHILQPAEVPGVTDGITWQSKRKNWIWETGHSVGTPVAISGVFVDDVFQSSGYYIDYNNGQVIFDSAISVGSEVKLEYSYKWVQVTNAGSLPFMKRAQYDSLRFDDDQFPVGSGANIELAKSRVQMPAIAVEMVMNGSEQPYELGSRAKIIDRDVIFHVLAESDTHARKLSDIITEQVDSTLFLLNTQTLAESGVFPLDYRGSVVNSSSTYPNLVDIFEYHYTEVKGAKMEFHKSFINSGEWLTDSLYHIPVRMTTRVILNGP